MSEATEGRKSPRILIVRLSAIGDVIHGLPVLNALRDGYPNALLGWAVEGYTATLLKGHPALDELITLPRGWLKSPAAVWRLRRQLRELEFDVALDLQGLTKSAVAAWLSGARRRIGFGDAKGRELSPWLNNELVWTTARHVIDCNLEQLRSLGIDKPAVRFDLPEREPDAAAAARMVCEAGCGEGFVAINPGAAWPSKLWPAERFAAVAAHLGDRWRLPSLVVWAGDAERALAEEIVAGSQGHARLAPATSLTELAAVTRRAKLFVSSDTGPLHIAVAVGTPSVGLFGPMPAERNGPYGPEHIAIQKVCFEGTSRERRNAPREVIEAITVEMVAEACDRILERAQPLAA